MTKQTAAVTPKREMRTQTVELAQQKAERQRKAASSQRRGVKAAQETRRLQQACIEVGGPLKMWTA